MNRAEKRRQRKLAKKHRGAAPDTQQALALAMRHHAEGRLNDAATMYQQILKTEPEHPVALHLLGVIAHQSGDNGTALDLITKAIAIKPDVAEAHTNLGNALQDLGRWDDAAASYRRALALKPDYVDALNNLGITLKEQGEPDEAAACYRRAIALKPESAELHSNLGNALKDLRQTGDAIACFRQAIALKPDFAEAHNVLGIALKNSGQTEDAVASYRRALAIKPDYAEAHYNLGNALQGLGRLDEAAASYDDALTLKPDDADSLNNLGAIYKNLGRLEEAVDCYRRALVLQPDFSGAERNLLSVMLNIPGLTPEDLFADHVRFAKAHCVSIPPPADPLTNDAAPERRLRIGYLSSDFWNHPLGAVVLPLISHHDRQKFEVFCYAAVDRPDATTERFRASADHWRDITATPDADIARMARADGIDVLVSLAGHFDTNRPFVCAHRAAPVQVSLHDGATSGLDEMDFWLTDGFLHGADTREKFTEALHRLPILYQWPPIDDAPTVASLPADVVGAVTFGSFNNPAKINDDVIRLWASVLNSIPDSRLRLKYRNWYGQASLCERLAEVFAGQGVGKDRLLFAADMDSFPEHLGRYGDIDIALDTFPFNGATTTYQALWMGVPVLSLTGDTFISRAAGSILHHAGLGELAVATPEDFIAKAQELAGDLERLRTLRAGLRERVAASPLCDAPAYARNVEAAYREMGRGWCA
ncbi:MAG: tetratricopeptide repeat protein [Proteobacteria bacterium]|nr:tetratricopeptide repeat protein [Pseudomonadota bacterium]